MENSEAPGLPHGDEAGVPPVPDVNPGDATLVPTLDVEIDTVSVMDGIWHDQPDNVAAFVEARLGDLARGRGNLYLCLDVSGEMEGRDAVERALVETIRDTYATSRGSISFALAEALRAANAQLYEQNRQAARESRRMAGISAVVLRGNDLYIAQAGPAVVYVEANETLTRYPGESDWFVEDSPLYSPQGSASAPLGVRREFASDLAHTSVGAGDVFVLATRALTQLASTEELAIAFTERSAQEIASHLENLGEDADFTALVAELMDPNASRVLVEFGEPTKAGHDLDPHIESFPVPLTSLVPLDESEPPLDEDEEDDAPTLDWDMPDLQTVEPEPTAHIEPPKPAPIKAEPPKPELLKLDPKPVYAAAAPITPAPTFTQPPARTQTPPPPVDDPAEIERRRAERAARRAAQTEGVTRAIGGVGATLAMVVMAIGGVFGRIFGFVDWERVGSSINRTLNMLVGAIINFFLLLVRLVLPGAPTRTGSLMTRRAASDPLWLKALAVTLPFVFFGLAGARYMQTLNSRDVQLAALVQQANNEVKQAELNPDKTQARQQFKDAQQLINQARTIRDTKDAQAVMFEIENQLNELDGIAVLYFMPTIADLGGSAQLNQIAANDQDVFLLNGQKQVYHYTVNDVTGDSTADANSGVILKTGDKVGDTTVGAITLLASAPRSSDKGTIVAVTDDALLAYDLESKQWTAQAVTDSKDWGKLTAIEGYGGNIYLLDAEKDQIYKYTPTANGYSNTASNYFSSDAPNLSKAVAMAIDGDVWILNSNGSVLRYRGGVSIPFSLGALDTPLKNPVAIFTQPEVDSLYIADAGNQRIIEFDKDGKYVRQFKPYAEKGDAFQNLMDFTVNETKRKLYFTNINAAYMANVPK